MLIELRRGVGNDGTIERRRTAASALPGHQVRLIVDESPGQLGDVAVDADSSHPVGTIRLLADFEHALTRRGHTIDASSYRALSRLRGVSPDADSNTLPLAEVDALQALLRSYLSDVRADGARGIGLIESSPTVRRTGLLRSWPDDTDDAELATDGCAVVRLDGLELVVVHTDDREPIVDVRSFQLGVDGAVVSDGAGVDHLLEQDATRALCEIADGATAWRVRIVPEVIVWAPLLAGLESVRDAIARTGRAATIQICDPQRFAAPSTS